MSRKLLTVFSGHLPEADLVVSLLEAEGLHPILQNAQLDLVYPGAVPVQIQVPEEERERALLAIAAARGSA